MFNAELKEIVESSKTLSNMSKRGVAHLLSLETGLDISTQNFNNWLSGRCCPNVDTQKKSDECVEKD